MKQYHKLLNTILEKGTQKPAARENMPGSLSLFGHQMRFDLQEGFPILTTKKIKFKNIVTELLWFLNGDTNIKYLIDNGFNLWNQDAYNYYVKICEKHNILIIYTFEEFIERVNEGYNGQTSLVNSPENILFTKESYIIGNCGFQYGKVWRRWRSPQIGDSGQYMKGSIDQIKNVINSIKNTPEGRRHIVTAIDPAHDTNLALYWCHAMFQFNCRPIPWETKLELAMRSPKVEMENLAITEAASGHEHYGIPQYYLDCQLYQRSADSFLGVPYNISSYALLTHIIAKICNMIPGDFIHTFGDVHIYNNHMEQVKEILTRQPKLLPQLKIDSCPNIDWQKSDLDEILKSINGFEDKTFQLENYNPDAFIKAELSTGMKK